MKQLAMGFLLFLGILLIGGAIATADTPVDTSDATITDAIRATFGADPLLANSTIQVDTDAGFVVLSGVVKTQEEIDKAVELANSVDGVRQVSSNIKVDSASRGDSASAEVQEANHIPVDEVEKPDMDQQLDNADASITEQILNDLSNDTTISSAKIEVETIDGTVRLSGTVTTKEQANRAMEIARAVNGVKNVKSDLIVKTS
jgi:hyperosmotically inducible protein